MGRGTGKRTLHWLGCATFRMGKDQGAKRVFLEALALCRQLNDRRRLAGSVAGLACSQSGSQLERTVRLIGTARAAIEGMGLHLNPVSQSEHDEVLASACARLGDAAFNVAWAMGRTMTLEQAVVEAVEELAG
jgi:hypothetical protein